MDNGRRLTDRYATAGLTATWRTRRPGGLLRRPVESALEMDVVDVSVGGLAVSFRTDGRELGARHATVELDGKIGTCRIRWVARDGDITRVGLDHVGAEPEFSWALVARYEAAAAASGVAPRPLPVARLRPW